MSPGRLDETLTRPLLRDNPITVQTLGICSALAVTTTLSTALTMCVALSAVMLGASTSVSALRHWIAPSTRLIVQITIIASLVIVVDLVLQAFLFDISQRLSVFVPLIVTNCLVLGRAEGFAMHHGIRDSVRDALGNAAGYSLILLAVAFVRELGGSGRLLGFAVLPTASDGGWFVPLTFLLEAPSAFFLLGLFTWLNTGWRLRRGATKRPRHTTVRIPVVTQVPR